MQFNLPGKQAREEKQLGVLVASGGTPRWLQTPASRIARDTLKIKKEGEMWNLGLIDLAAVAQEKRLSDTPCSTLESYGEGPQRVANGQGSWDFFKDAQGLERLDAGSRAGFASSGIFSIFLTSVRERMLEIRARSSRDGQVKSDLVPTAGGIGPDGTVGTSSPSTLATTFIFRCKRVGHGEVIRCRRRRVGARGGTGFVDGSGEATAVGKVAGPPGTSDHRSSFRNTSHINSDRGNVRCLRADGSV